MANNGAGRAAEVSGLVTVTADGASGTLTTGYIVGCQVDITGLEGGLNASIDSSLSLGLDGSLTFPLAPGEAAFVPLGTKSFEGGVASVQYKRQGIEVQQCGGYAQARAFTTVQTEGNYVIKSTLYGAPFSLN
ncbi:MspA family porin [Williamsia sp. DF01-3]|nr:MspA family porin [Williamsia sp. DF01-3]MCK0517833.1 MspA family porin [Williamsia sp. DF01-3]